MSHVFEVTGPELLSFHDVAQRFSQLLEKNVEVTCLPIEQYVEQLRQLNVPSTEIELTYYLFTELLDGRNEYVTPDLKNVLGRESNTFNNFISNVKETQVWQ